MRVGTLASFPTSDGHAADADLDHDNPARAEKMRCRDGLDHDNPARAEKMRCRDGLDHDNPARAEKMLSTSRIGDIFSARAGVRPGRCGPLRTTSTPCGEAGASRDSGQLPHKDA
ncbi:hypothetical protein [Nostocoides japonicum]|uniref:hypothetical protein n=1 Tax=Nostocoides japonicum TaxID=99481 RepID=UPI0012FB09FA|nr:hypothetical protein [Tetrasphaera japonica]